MPKPTKQEIDAERKALKHLKKYIPVRGPRPNKPNQHDMISAQVQVLGMNLTLEEIKQAWPEGDEVQGAAEDARFWMDTGSILSPTQSWESLRIAGIEKVAKVKNKPL